MNPLLNYNKYMTGGEIGAFKQCNFIKSQMNLVDHIKIIKMKEGFLLEANTTIPSW